MFFRASSAEERKSVLATIAASNKLAVFKKNLGISEWKMLLQVSVSKWNGIGLSEIPIWCGILKWEMSCQQVGLFHSHQTHFVLTFLCSKFLEFFTPQTFHLPVLILQQFAIGQHFPLDGNPFLVHIQHYLCKGTEKCTTNRLQNGCTQYTARIEKSLSFLSFSVFLG